jgi:hypothetical protein
MCVAAACRSVRWVFADIVPDYLCGQNTAVLFLSLRCEPVCGFWACGGTGVSRAVCIGVVLQLRKEGGREVHQLRKPWWYLTVRLAPGGLCCCSVASVMLCVMWVHAGFQVATNR